MESILENTKCRKAFSYIRVSTMKQMLKGTHLSQQRMVREFCIQNKIEHVSEFVDLAQSGASVTREGFHNLLSRLKEDPSIKYILVAHFDRLAREKIMGMRFIVEIAELGCKIIEVASGTTIDPNDNMVLLIATFNAISSDTERKKINENITGGIAEYIAVNGHWGPTPKKLTIKQIKTIRDDYLPAKLKNRQIARLIHWDHRTMKRELLLEGLIKIVNNKMVYPIKFIEGIPQWQEEE